MSMENKTYDYYGNVITQDGKIFNSKGDELIISKRGTVMIKIEGKKHIYKAGRVVYEAISGVKLTDPYNLANGVKNYVLTFKDGNETHTSYDNLILKTREEYFKGKKWGTEKYPKEIREAIIADYNKTGAEHVSYRKLSEKYGCSSSTIRMYLKKSREEAKKNNEKVESCKV